MSLSPNFEAHTLQNHVVVFFRLGVEDENGQALLSSLEALTFKIQGKTVSNYTRRPWRDQLGSTAACSRIKYDRTCQRSIEIIGIEKTFSLHKSAQKKHFFLEFFLKKALDELYLII